MKEIKLFQWCVKLLFLVLLGRYIVFALIEEFEPGFVSHYVSLGWFLVIFFLVAVIFFMTHDRYGTEVAQTVMRRGWFLIFMTGLVTLGLIFMGARALDMVWRVLISVYGGLVAMAILAALSEE